LAERGYDKQMGARPMARLIQENLKKPLAEKILFGELANGGGHVDITVENNVIVLHVEEVEKNAATPA
jgi:ATP-dependent Clp protease ATP-binding subunit ClpA